jgi:hypothetical protein
MRSVLSQSSADPPRLSSTIARTRSSSARSADLVLHVVLARTAACIPHTVELPPIVGSVGSLNFYAAGIGSSGSGKSTAVATGRELVPAPPGLDIADDRPIGSGEGIAEAYMGTVEQETEDGKKARMRAQVRHNAFIYVDEGEALVDMMHRKLHQGSSASVRLAQPNVGRSGAVYGGCPGWLSDGSLRCRSRPAGVTGSLWGHR